ncbi:MAG: hypothetical protein GOMPHAMPRED_008154 [Gomphillus americanus]|uniref:NmrA-like domain-containing protein n=1 Tax=Gomphillus americanus TaxID=1940652 RepID=A0A8H3IBA5_9LECA|nr:MAG: hypothetical protein GOMPHAMPRED_008154 [Gomphillus americanus]
MSFKSVVVVGGGGNLAPVLIKTLLQSSLKVTVLSRQSSRGTFPPDVNVVKISDEYPHDEIVAALKGHDAVVSTFTSVQKAVIDASIEAGIKRFVPAEFGSDNRSAEAQAAVPLWKDKVAAVDYLKSKESSGLSWTAVACNPFFDWAFNVTKGGFFKIDLKNKKALVFDNGNHLWSTSNLHQVGLAVRRVLENPEVVKNKYVFVESFTITQNQLLDGLEKGLDIKFDREVVDGKPWLAEQARQSAAGNVPAQYSAIIGWSILYGNFKDLKEYGNELLGIPLENFDESLKEIVESLKA